MRCANCPGVAHPASGSFHGRRADGSAIIVCGPCVRRFWGWFLSHQNAAFRAGCLVVRRVEPGYVVLTPHRVYVRFYDHVEPPARVERA